MKAASQYSTESLHDPESIPKSIFYYRLIVDLSVKQSGCMYDHGVGCHEKRQTLLWKTSLSLLQKVIGSVDLPSLVC